MKEFFQIVLYKPLYNLLIVLVSFMPGHDMGLAIVGITILIRLILHPFSISAFRGQRAVQRMQPKLRELKAKYKDDQQGFAQASMELYKNNEVNPLASCLPLLLQLPILIALYWVLRAGLTSLDASLLYSFTAAHAPSQISSVGFGFLHLNQPSWLIAIAAGAAQFVQAKMMQTPPPVVDGEGSKDEAMLAAMNKQMLYVMPLLTIFIGWKLPAGLTMYWFLATLLTVLQQWYIFRALDKEEEEKNKKIANA
ncbi:MAG: YidC/Oxa1 family membrane protein insertase [Candidatus Magasanikbacteria bacterium]|nr:YidC/Oxa1 family membrane protein insertase [Candidatus Magasanikbacteria bacterium]